MTTRDSRGNLHKGAGAPDGGRFAAKSNSAPIGELGNHSAKRSTAIVMLDDADPDGGFDLAVEAPTGRYYLREGYPHREDGPAYEGSDGTQEWRLDGELHREGAPAVIHDDGSEEFWEHGRLVSSL